jgi:hypothetical protein
VFFCERFSLLTFCKLCNARFGAVCDMFIQWHVISFDVEQASCPGCERLLVGKVCRLLSRGEFFSGFWCTITGAGGAWLNI